MLARGVILDPEAKRVVASPFPKFFNVGEKADSIPNLPFETFEKLDGSLIILFYHKGEWRTSSLVQPTGENDNGQGFDWSTLGYHALIP